MLISSFRRPFSTAVAGEPFKTALFAHHQDIGGKMVEFAGYSLPVQYSDGVLASHLHTRGAGNSSVFDVGHMGQLRWHGKDAAAFVETVVVGDIASLKAGEAKLSLITNHQGGLLDDCVITNLGDNCLSMVVNGATKYQDMEHFKPHLEEFNAAGGDVSMEYLHERNLLALQGPGAAVTLQGLIPSSVDLSQVPFMQALSTTVSGVNCLVTRCGYTGEDGFEVSMEWDDANTVFSSLLEQPNVLPAGLGARDSLRLEAGLCLYGNDLDETTTPIEAALAWTIPKSRRTGDRANFVGADVILSQLKDKSWERRRVGLGVEKVPARAGTKIVNEEGEEVGEVTSGTMSPSLKRPIAMGYVKKGFHKVGTKLSVVVRNKQVPAVVEKMPFVPANYYSPPK